RVCLVAVEDYIDVGITGGVQIAEKVWRKLSGEGRDTVANAIERDAERGAPVLVPALMASIAAAVGAPALDTVGAAPGGVLDDLGFVLGRKQFQELAVIGELRMPFALDALECPGQRHFAERMMVAVAFSVGGDVDELAAMVALIGEAVEEALNEAISVIQQALERDGPRDGAVVEEDGDGTIAAEAHQIGPGGIDRGVGSFGPSFIFGV